MADIAAPAAPAAGGANVSTPAPGTPAPTGAAPGPKGSPAPAAKQSATSAQPRPRNNNGQFAPADGNVSTEPPAPAEPPKDPYRFKRKLKVYGQEEEVDLDEDGLTRELQRSRAMAKKLGEFDAQAKRAARILELAEKDPEAFLRELKQDPDEIARRRLAQQARLEAMTPEERELEELRQYRQRTEAQQKEAEERAAQERKDRLRKTLVEKNNQRFIAALEKGGLPKTYESLYYIAETAKIAHDDGIELSEDELVKETSRRLDMLTERYLGTLDGKTLVKRLGPKRVQAILEAAVADFDAQQNFEAPPTPVEPEPKEDEPEFIDSAEVERRLRAMRNGR